MSFDFGSIELTADEIKRLIKSQYKARLFRGIQTRPIAITGHTGVGKTAIFHQTAKELQIELTEDSANSENEHPVWDEIRKRVEKGTFKVKCFVSNLSVLEAPDFMGMPIVEDGKTIYGRPSIFPDYDAFAICFFDEANRTNSDIRNGLLELIQFNKINSHKLGPYTVSCLAMNPSQTDNGVAYEVEEFDNALNTRLFHANFKFSMDELLSFLRSTYEKHSVIDWINNQPQVVDFQGKTKCNPRALEALINRLNIEGDPESDFTYMSEKERTWIFKITSGEIGSEPASVYKAFLESKQILRHKDILNNYLEEPWIAELTLQFNEENRNDAIYAVINAMCDEIKLIEGESKEEDIVTIPERWVDNIHAFLSDLNNDHVPSFFNLLNDLITDPTGKGNPKYLALAKAIIKVDDKSPSNKILILMKKQSEARKKAKIENAERAREQSESKNE